MSETGIGATVLRREDRRFISGRGNYVDDVNRPGQVYAHFVRSPHAHADVKSVDTTAAAAADGVVAVLTGADVAADGLGGLPVGWGITSQDGSPMIEPPWPIIAHDRVRYVGEAVAVVIAATRDQAKDAAELVAVDYNPLPAIISTPDSIRDGVPQVWDDAKHNICFDWGFGDADATNDAFAKASHVTTVDLVNQRLIPNAIEPRSSVADFDSSTGEMTLWCTSQGPHAVRLLLGAFVLQQPEHKFRVISPDVGGGFGSKIYPYAEYATCCWAARRLGVPVKWTAERSESFLTDAHGRDHVTKAELAMDADGRFLGLRVSTIANMGAYLSAFAPLIPTYLYATLFAGQYTTPAFFAEVKAVFTNTTPVDAYRGAGRPEATFMLERLIDAAAKEVGVDPVDIRRRNFIAPDAFPYQTPVALLYDSGNYGGALDKALELSDYAGFEARRKE
ncbi:MAG: xanthine dehydrogenase family protein molybdopterin-binding subunit, partial [Bauldia litoralis]